MIIGITTTYVEEEPRRTRSSPSRRVTVEYVRRVAAAGAVPVLLPPVEGGADANRRAARELVERLDGLDAGPAAGISTRRRTATKRAWLKP